MLRGSGKRENYNLNYSRFDKFDDVDAEEDLKQSAVKPDRKPEVEADAAGGPTPDMRELLSRMPPELREAQYLMQMSRMNGDAEAQKRASELAIRAVQNGSPEVRETFLKNVAKEMPELEGMLSQELNGDAKSLLKNMQDEAVRKKVAETDDPNQRFESLRKTMEEGQRATQRELENLRKRQDELERLRTPEDVMKFMTEGGITQEDFQRIMSGDEEHMKKKFNEQIDSQLDKDRDGKSMKDYEDTLGQIEEIHKLVNSTSLDAPDSQADMSALVEVPQPATPKEPEILVPMYRLQYTKDDEGHVKVVELKCTLPGVADMSIINLDVSEKHIRLNTVAPAPRYAVNAGPFPVRIDPSGARAKYSKKREELSISVPAKAE
jgi:hypothetical protein